MTDEKFLKLAREHCAQEWSMDGYAPTVELEEENFLTLCREIERRTLERAAKEIEPFDAEPISFKSAAGLIRAMIKEKE